MTKRLFVAALAVCLWMTRASGHTILQRSDWQERGLETYLPPPIAPTVPWLNNTKNKLPKGDLPLGRDTSSAGRFVLPSMSADTQVSSKRCGIIPESLAMRD